MSGLTPQNFEMVAGDAKTLAIPVTDETGAAVDLSAASALRFVIGFPTPVEKTLGDGCAAAGDGNSTLEVTLEPQDTADQAGVFPIQAQVTLNGDPATVLVGDLTLHPRL